MRPENGQMGTMYTPWLVKKKSPEGKFALNYTKKKTNKLQGYHEFCFLLNLRYNYWLLYRLPELPDPNNAPGNQLIAPVGRFFN